MRQNESKMTEATKIQGIDDYSSYPQSHPAFVSHGWYYRSFCASRLSCSWWWRASSIPHRLREISPRQCSDFANFSPHPKKPPGRMELHGLFQIQDDKRRTLEEFKLQACFIRYEVGNPFIAEALWLMVSPLVTHECWAKGPSGPCRQRSSAIGDSSPSPRDGRNTFGLPQIKGWGRRMFVKCFFF